VASHIFVSFARQQGYRVDELIRIIEDVG